MEDKQMPLTSPETLAESNVGRRKLLKLIAATSGAVAASLLLPEKWTQPFVQVGTLPAHAQVTPVPRQLQIANLLIENPPRFRAHVRSPTYPTMNASFTYEDTGCKVDDTAQVFLACTPDGQVISGDAIGTIGSRTGDPCAGSMTVPFWYHYMNSTDLSVYIVADGLASNTLTESLPLPT